MNVLLQHLWFAALILDGVILALAFARLRRIPVPDRSWARRTLLRIGGFVAAVDGSLGALQLAGGLSQPLFMLAGDFGNAFVLTGFLIYYGAIICAAVFLCVCDGATSVARVLTYLLPDGVVVLPSKVRLMAALILSGMVLGGILTTLVSISHGHY